MGGEDNSLAIAAAKYNLDASRKTLRARKSDHLPTVDIAGQYGHNVTAPIVSQGIVIGGGAFDRTSLALSVFFVSLCYPWWQPISSISETRVALFFLTMPVELSSS